MGDLLGPTFARGRAAAAATEHQLLAAMFDVEAGLARAQAVCGIIPAAAARAIAAACVTDHYDMAAIGVEGARHAQPVVALVQAIRARVGEEVAPYVHHGATSQDILDTALMVVAKRVITDGLSVDLSSTSERLARLAEAHARTPMIGRTLMQQAIPITFGLKAVGWTTELDEVRSGLCRAADSLQVQLGGPVGTLHDPRALNLFAETVGLNEPALPWHTNRQPVGQLAGALGLAAGAVAKFAKDVILLVQTEVGELHEVGYGGGSSSMAHKHNPVAAISAVACAHRVPGLVATLLAGIPGEHERAAGVWQAEWPTLLELLSVTGSAACWAAELSGRLDVNVGRMAVNLGAIPVRPETVDAAAALVATALGVRRR